eukprot:scaffold233392_cov17-Tisochrysis_lutea.AAC.2
MPQSAPSELAVQCTFEKLHRSESMQEVCRKCRKALLYRCLHDRQHRIDLGDLAPANPLATP